MYERCPRAVEPLWVEGAGHNDIELYAQYLERLKQFISHELPNSWRNLLDLFSFFTSVNCEWKNLPVFCTFINWISCNSFILWRNAPCVRADPIKPDCLLYQETTLMITTVIPSIFYPHYYPRRVGVLERKTSWTWWWYYLNAVHFKTFFFFSPLPQFVNAL